MTRRRRVSVVRVLAWGVVAAIVAAGLSRRDGSPDASPDASTAAARDSIPVDSIEPEHAPVRVLATPPSSAIPAPAPVAKRPVRELPKPFASLQSFATPLIMPRLKLPRVLTPRLSSLSHLLERARPGEPVAVTLTAYCLDGTTRRGKPVRPGIIAADPRIFPLARHVELFSGGRFLGRFLVDDTGGRIRGTRIDIWTPDCDDARRFGTRPGVATLIATE